MSFAGLRRHYYYSSLCAHLVEAQFKNLDYLSYEQTASVCPVSILSVQVGYEAKSFCSRLANGSPASTEIGMVASCCRWVRLFSFTSVTR